VFISAVDAFGMLSFIVQKFAAQKTFGKGVLFFIALAQTYFDTKSATVKIMID
jgi:hypothetical protein